MPKAKQDPELCTLPPRSVCDSNYGLSIGRGAWQFVRGGWTTVRQDIWLNTPGANDGGFNIWVNDRLVLSFDHVRYRETVGGCVAKDQVAGSETSDSMAPPIEPILTYSQQTPSSSLEVSVESVTASGSVRTDSAPIAPALGVRDEQSHMHEPAYPWADDVWQAQSSSVTLSATDPGPTIVYPFKVGHNTPPGIDQCAVGFIGLFFSTFFGGHTDDWSPSEDQYTYFKDFKVGIIG